MALNTFPASGAEKDALWTSSPPSSGRQNRQMKQETQVPLSSAAGGCPGTRQLVTLPPHCSG